jgi:hypothetical protein
LKSNRPPDPTKLKLNSALKKDPQIIKWTQRLLGDPEARPTDLTEEQLTFLVNAVNQQRGESLDESAYARAMIKTCPQFAAPDFTNLADDLEIVFSQPEMRDFWEAWTGEVAGHGPSPNYPPAKAVMAVLGMGGVSSHVDTAHETFASSKKLQDIFSGVEGDLVESVPYSSLCRMLKKLGPSCTSAAIETNIALAKKLRELFPNAGIGERLLMDSSSVPAWCRQKSSHGNEQMEKILTARTPEAKAKAYSYSSNGKSTLSASDKVKVGTAKFWRGYFFSVIVDQASGLPLVWMLHAATDETKSIVPLLSQLYKLWPDIGAQSLTADSLWDKPKWHRLCEVEYGIHPIFRQMPSTKTGVWEQVKEGMSRDGAVARITSQGQLVCADHGKPLPYDSFDAPSRNGLYAGKSSDERLFRVRANCTHTSKTAHTPCGRIGLKAMANWGRLTFYPHHGVGHPERFAMRQAMLTRLNQVEGVFNRLKAGKFLGNEGAARTRILDHKAVEALFSLACLSMTASLVAEQRMLAQAKAPQPKPAVPKLPVPHAMIASNPNGAKKVGAKLAGGGSAISIPELGVFKRGRRRLNVGVV